jgi:uncharacterized protein (DUF305 family)
MNTKGFGRALAVTAIVGVAVAGCGGGTDTASTGAPGSAAPTAGAAQNQQNEADVQFAQGMIVHHRQALQMAELATGRSQNPQVQDLAGRISAAQGPEIETMSGWLEQWGEDVPAEGDMGGMPGMDHGAMPGMSGGMTPEQMQQLEQATGAEFDRMFLEMMIEHHRGAVEMAQTEVQSGAYPEAKQLAQNVITTQQGEITEMETLLRQL